MDSLCVTQLDGGESEYRTAWRSHDDNNPPVPEQASSDAQMHLGINKGR